MAKLTEKKMVVSYTLELSPEEASVLRLVWGHIRGSGPTRDVTDSIWATLASQIDKDDTHCIAKPMYVGEG